MPSPAQAIQKKQRQPAQKVASIPNLAVQTKTASSSFSNNFSMPKSGDATQQKASAFKNPQFDINQQFHNSLAEVMEALKDNNQ
jgi:hypothetical protein